MLKSFAYGLVFLILAGSVGIPVYQHTCLHEKLTINTLFVASDHCEEEHVDVVIPDCCAIADVENSSHVAVKDNCCVDQVDHWHFSCFGDGKIPVASLGVYISDFSEVHPQIIQENLANSQTQVTNLGNDPPPLNVSERLALHCIWRI